MKNSIKAIILTIVFATIGIFLDMVLNTELGIIFSIAIMGYYTIKTIEDKNK